MTFIERHLIERINKVLIEKQSILKHSNFYYFDEPIRDKKKIIDRVSRFNPYHKEEILPASWYSLNGSTLREIFMKLKNNDFYVYKGFEDGKSYKTRIKKSANKRI